MCRFKFWDAPNEAIIRFLNNTVESNHGIPENIADTRNEVTHFSIGILGCPVPDFLLQYNIFNNQDMDKEFFLGSGDCGAYHGELQLNARYNWWGTSDAKEIARKIFDFGDWNDRGYVRFLPVSTSRNFISFNKTVPFINSSRLGGYKDTSLRLTVENSPYLVETDLTINWNSNITIDPGVTLLFESRVGLLVLGNIFAIGSKDKPIRFCSFETRCNTSKIHSYGNLRLSEAYKGYLEMFENGAWNLVCWKNFHSLSAKVACRELGSDDTQSFSRKQDNYNLGPFLQKSFDCYGNESSLVILKSFLIYFNFKEFCTCSFALMLF